MSLSYVVDSSLVVDALAAREGDDVLRQRLSAPRTLHAPHHLDVEVASTVRGLAAGKKITDRRGEQMLADYSRLRITRHPVWPYHPRMWELRHNLGAYDAAYIALAEALGCALLTGDVKLKNATGHHATVIVSRLSFVFHVDGLSCRERARWSRSALLKALIEKITGPMFHRSA